MKREIREPRLDRTAFSIVSLRNNDEERQFWLARSPQERMQALEISPSLFLDPEKTVRMGIPPIRIKILTSIDGVTFEDCYQNRVVADFDGIPVSVIHLEDLITNKRASGRYKDLDDIEHLK